MKNIIIILFLSLSYKAGFSQSAVQNTIKKSIVVDKKELYAEMFKKKGFMFYLGLSINENGRVDSVFHSQSDLFSTKITDIDVIVKKLKSEKTAFKEYKGQVLITLINLRRGDDDAFQIPKDFSEAFKSTAIHAAQKMKNRKVTYIDALLIVI